MDTTDLDERPDYACILHRPPSDERYPWACSDPGYRTCSGCLDRLRAQLREIGTRYRLLDPSLGGSMEAGGRGAPGFGSRAPASDHVIAMLDPRSSQTARIWIGGDGKVHAEDERPPVSVRGQLDIVAWTVAEARGITGPTERADVADLLRFLDAQLDYVTRTTLAAEVAVVVRALVAALRPVTGEPRARRVGSCPVVVDEVACGAPLFAPARGDTIRCSSCGHEWPRPEWLQLGLALQAAS